MEDRVRGLGGEWLPQGWWTRPRGHARPDRLFLREDADLMLCYVAPYALERACSIWFRATIK